MIFDVTVRLDSRNQGLGQKLIPLTKSHRELERVRDFELYCLPEMKGYYVRLGYFEIYSKAVLMRCTGGKHK